MLICPENMKQLSFKVSGQWVEQYFQVKSHNVKVKGQNSPAVHRSHGELIYVLKI